MMRVPLSFGLYLYKSTHLPNATLARRKSMRRFLTLSLVVLALAVPYASSAAAQASVQLTGPYYATPAWDQTLASSTRFLILIGFSNQAVLDRETGLVWQRSPDTAPTTWLNARKGCIN